MLWKKGCREGRSGLLRSIWSSAPSLCLQTLSYWYRQALSSSAHLIISIFEYSGLRNLEKDPVFPVKIQLCDCIRRYIHTDRLIGFQLAVYPGDRPSEFHLCNFAGPVFCPITAHLSGNAYVLRPYTVQLVSVFPVYIHSPYKIGDE